MSDRESTEAIRQVCGVILQMHNEKQPEPEIVTALSTTGMTKKDSKKLVRSVIEAYKNGVDLSKKPSFWDDHPFLREWGLILLGAVIVFGVSAALSLVLSLIQLVFNLVGLETIGKILIKFGGNAAGIVVGFIGTAISSESRSLGMVIGCWVGVVIYYLWIFEVFEFT